MWLFVLVFCLLQARGEVNLPTDSEPPLMSESLTTDDERDTTKTMLPETTVNLNKASRKYAPQTFKLQSEVTSGPVVLVDKKTLFIPAFRYKGDHKNVRFWVGNGTEPDSKGVAVPDEKGSLNDLHAYFGENLYLHLPTGVTTDNVEYFGVWSLDEKKSLGHVDLKGVSGVPEVQSTLNDKFRVPKCCPVDFVITTKGCQNVYPVPFKPQFKVYEHNETHFNNVSLDVNSIDFEPYAYNLQCLEGKYYLFDSPPEEEFALLRNGSLLMRSKIKSGIFSQQDFCMDNIENDTEMHIFVCAPTHEIQQGMFLTYMALTFISTFCFIGAFFLYFFYLKIEDVHRKVFTAYVASMALTFLSLIIVQLAYVEDGGCKVLGYLFQFSMIAAFTLLAILCFDIYFIVKTVDKHAMKRRRTRWYFGIALAVPILSLVISLARNQTPDVPNSFFKPQYRKNSCSYAEDKQRSIFFYLPILASIIIGFVFLVLTKLLIVKYEDKMKNKADWIDNRMNFKFMLRKYIIVTAVSFMWPVEIIMQLYAPSTGILIALEIIEASQGVIVLILFVLNSETRKLILKRIKAHRRQMRQPNATLDEQDELANGIEMRS